MAVSDDLSWFESNRKFISATYQGQWVIVKDQAIKGAYPSSSAAMTAGYQMFGTQPFVVKQALPEEQVHQVPTK